VPPSGTDTVWFWFEPTDLNRTTTQASWTAPEIVGSDGKPVVKFDSLIANAITPSLTFGSDTVANIDCPYPRDSIVRLYFLLANTGTQSKVLDRMEVTNPNQFVNLVGHDQHRGVWDPTKGPQNIPPGAVDTFSLDFPITPNTSQSGTTKIWADGFNDTIGHILTATVNVNFYSEQVDPKVIPFGPVAYKSGAVSGTFTITNTASSDLVIDDMSLTEGGKYNSSYSFSIPPPLPDTLHPAQDLIVTVLFDPSVSRDTAQNTIVEIFSNACTPMEVSLNASLHPSSGVAEKSTPLSAATVTALEDGQSIRVTIPPDWTPPVNIDIFNILGESIFSTSFGGTSLFDLGSVPRGVYFYRLRMGDRGQTGKILLGQ